MATALNITSTFAGVAAKDYLHAALLSNNTITEKGITVKPNVKGKMVIRRIVTSGIVKNATCDFTAAGTINKDEKILEPKLLDVNTQICKKDLLADWEAEEMGVGVYSTLPKNITDFLVQEHLGLISEATENSIWGGDSANTGEFDGFIKLWTADSTVLDVASPVAGGITAANVLAEFKKIYATVPKKLLNKADLRMYVAQDVWSAYLEALGGFGASGLGANGVNGKGTVMNNIGEYKNFLGIKIFVANGMTAGYAAVAQTSNLFFGTSLMSDMNEIKVIDTAQTLGDKNVRFVASYSAGVQYGFGNEVVLYTPA